MNWRGQEKQQCKAVSTSTADAGYNDNYRGWYDVQGCGQCNDYCRWVGNGGAGGDPATKLSHGSSWWSCRLAGSSAPYSSNGYFSSWSRKKCSSQGAVPSLHTLAHDTNTTAHTVMEQEASAGSLASSPAEASS